MNHGRLRAYEVLLRVAQVRELRASLALAEASAEERLRRLRCTEIVNARDAVTTASRASVSGSSRLDMARYEMLSNLDVTLAERMHVASHELTAAETVSQERADASVMAKRYRERIGDHVKEGRETIDRKHSANKQEEAIELWLEGKLR